MSWYILALSAKVNYLSTGKEPPAPSYHCDGAAHHQQQLVYNILPFTFTIAHAFLLFLQSARYYSEATRLFAISLIQHHEEGWA
jgi:hypothetical protein